MNTQGPLLPGAVIRSSVILRSFGHPATAAIDLLRAAGILLALHSGPSVGCTMRQLAQISWLLAILVACSGCSVIAEGLVDAALGAAVGETEQERKDREALEAYRRLWSTPGRNAWEIEAEARGTFRRVHGREPNLNWHAR